MNTIYYVDLFIYNVAITTYVLPKGDIFWHPEYDPGLSKYLTRGMLLLTKAKRPLKFKMLCGFNKHAVKLRMHKAAPYAFPLPLKTF